MILENFKKKIITFGVSMREKDLLQILSRDEKEKSQFFEKSQLLIIINYYSRIMLYQVIVLILSIFSCDKV